MKEVIFILADLWMVFAGFFCGWRFLRQYGNHLLGLEWMIVGTSGVNFLIWALRGGDVTDPQSMLVSFFDAFSRGVGITLILIMGLLRVTHRYKPGPVVDIGAFVLATSAGLYLMRFGGHGFSLGPATFFVVVNALTTLFLIYFTWRVWNTGARGPAVGTALATAAGSVIAITYDFFPLPGDDAHRTIFAAAALATWGTQLFVYFLAYRAMENHNRATEAGAVPMSLSTAGGQGR
ncbi:transporter [Streptomyces sp. NPDC015661]|uniref:transporter n=1 Tax=Streptomyces sp. NPDC015661 TaxID=3364961 RepID=UPI0036FFE8DC